MNDDESPRVGVRALAWPLAAALMTTLVVAVGCGDDAGSGASSQGGDHLASATSGASTSGGPGATTTGGGDGGAGATTGVAVASVGPGPVSVSASSTGVGGAPPECDPPADPSSLYAREAVDYATFQPVSMCEYRDQVLLIVNIAAL